MSLGPAERVRACERSPIRLMFDLAEAAADYDAYVVADEVYAALTHDRDPTGIAALTGRPEHVLTVGSCSKSHAMTGWRVGRLAGDRAITDEATKIRESTTSCASSVSQHAAIAALTGTERPVAAMQEAFRERRDYVVERIAGVDGVAAPRPRGRSTRFSRPRPTRRACRWPSACSARRGSSSRRDRGSERPARATCGSRSPAPSTGWRRGSIGWKGRSEGRRRCIGWG